MNEFREGDRVEYIGDRDPGQLQVVDSGPLVG